MSLFDEYDVPKELTEDAYDALELARDTGKIKRGSNEVTKTIERGQANIVYLAKDVEPEEVIAHLPLLCKEKATPFIFVPSKDELGVSSGLEVSTAAVAVVKSGKATPRIKEIIESLEALSKGEEIPSKAEEEKPEEPEEEKPEEPEEEKPEEPEEEKPEKPKKKKTTKKGSKKAPKKKAKGKKSTTKKKTKSKKKTTNKTKEAS